MEFEGSSPRSKEPATCQFFILRVFKQEIECMKIVITVCVVGHCALNPALAILMGFTKSAGGSVTRQMILSVTHRRNCIECKI